MMFNQPEIWGTPRVRVESMIIGLCVAVPLMLIGEFAVLDFLTLHDQAGGAFLQPHTWLDDHIPFISWFSIPYWLYFLIVFMTAWVPETRKEILQMVGALLLLNAVAYSLYVIFPSSAVPLRPNLVCETVACGFAGAMYMVDPGYAVMPSMHVGNSVLAAYFFITHKHPWRYFVTAFAALITISTLLMRQHYILDLPAGAILGLFMAWAGSRGFGWVWDTMLVARIGELQPAASTSDSIQERDSY